MLISNNFRVENHKSIKKLQSSVIIPEFLSGFISHISYFIKQSKYFKLIILYLLTY